MDALTEYLRLKRWMQSTGFTILYPKCSHMHNLVAKSRWLETLLLTDELGKIANIVVLLFQSCFVQTYVFMLFYNSRRSKADKTELQFY